MLKNIFKFLPKIFKIPILKIVEWWYYKKILRKQSVFVKLKRINNTKKKVLIYHSNCFGYGGTETNLQIIADALSDKYDVYLLGSTQNNIKNRKQVLEKKFKVIDFTYKNTDPNYPNFIDTPNLNIIETIYGISPDLIVTASAGRPEYPINIIRDIPILLINIFGSPCVQKNVKRIYFNAEITKHAAEKFTGINKKYKVMRIPILCNISPDTKIVRNKLNIPENAFVFGRIGRPDDNIFDPIGILAFEKLVKEYNNAYYIIVSPSQLAIDLVNSKKIKNVLFLPTTAREQDKWDFYYSIDTLAHFRLDGETQGLNICEAMYAGKPIITHKSGMWNGHLEYLNKSFSRVSEIDDISEYYRHMKEMINIKNQNPQVWQNMSLSAKDCVNNFFNKDTYCKDIMEDVQSLIK